MNIYYLSYLTIDSLWKIEVLHDLKYGDIEIFYSELLKQLYIETLVHDNILKDYAIKILGERMKLSVLFFFFFL